MSQYKRILSEIADRHGVTVKAIQGKGRAQPLPKARYEAIVELNATGALSNSAIARLLHMNPSSVWLYRHASTYAGSPKWNVKGN